MNWRYNGLPNNGTLILAEYVNGKHTDMHKQWYGIYCVGQHPDCFVFSIGFEPIKTDGDPPSVSEWCYLDRPGAKWVNVKDIYQMPPEDGERIAVRGREYFGPGCWPVRTRYGKVVYGMRDRSYGVIPANQIIRWTDDATETGDVIITELEGER